jgi:mono/diheme cytochrome c family protein
MRTRLGWSLFLMLAIIQVVPAPYRIQTRPHETESSISQDPDVPRQVKEILRRSCADCHSNTTSLPWYGHVAPVSWLLARDVERARTALDFSRWNRLSPPIRMALAAIACEDVRKERMPPASYRLMHRQARLSPSEVEAFCTWSRDLMTKAPRIP